MIESTTSKIGIAMLQGRRLIAALLLGGTTLAAASGASALTVYVGQDATFRYINTTAATAQAVPADWFAFDFDDSGWFQDQGPFSSGGASTFGTDLANVNDPFGPGTAPPLPTDPADYIYWHPNYDPYVRTEFMLAAPTALTVWLAVDNGIGPYPAPPGSTGMYLNGVEATASVNAEGQAFRWEHVFDIPEGFTFAGRNVFAVNLEDHGGATAFAMVVTSDDPASHPVFSTNPPPPPPAAVPEPYTLPLLVGGLALVFTVRRRQRQR